MLKGREDGRSRKHVCFSEGAMHFYWVGLKCKPLGLCLELHFNFPERFVKSRLDCLAGCWIPKRFLSCRNPVLLLCEAFGNRSLCSGRRRVCCWRPSRVRGLGLGVRPRGCRGARLLEICRGEALPEKPGGTENFGKSWAGPLSGM